MIKQLPIQPSRRLFAANPIGSFSPLQVVSDTLPILRFAVGNKVARYEETLRLNNTKYREARDKPDTRRECHGIKRPRVGRVNIIVDSRSCVYTPVRVFSALIIPFTTPPAADRESRRGWLLAARRGVQGHTRGAGGKRDFCVVLEAQMQKTLPFAKFHCQLGRGDGFAGLQVLPDLRSSTSLSSEAE